jgi:multidrug efflux pump subunit AcrB
MRQLISFFVNRPHLANIITLMIVLLGLLSLSNLKRDTFPKVDMGEMIIVTRYPGAAPADVELNVTNKLEKELKSVDGIKRYLSTSIEEVSTIHIVLESDASDLDKIKEDIREALAKVNDLPQEVTDQPTIMEIQTESFPIIEIGVAGDVPYAELLTYAKRLEKKLENLPGVAKLDPYGYFDREVHIKTIPQKLNTYQISLQEIITAIRHRNIRASMGTFENTNGAQNIITDNQFKKPNDVENVIIRSNFAGNVIRVKDLATIDDGFETPKVLSRINGSPAISFFVQKSAHADVLDTIEAIERLAQTEQQFLPDTIQIVSAHDFSKYLKNRLKVMTTNGILGLCFVLVVLGFFFNFRTSFWVAIGIPVSLMGVFFLMPLFDISINVISLLAMIIIIGIIVDDAIIIAESIAQHREAGKSPKDAAVDGLMEVYKPVLTTIATTFLAFAPMFFMPGTMGKFIFVIPVIITFALIFSMVEGLTALPAHLLKGMEGLKKETSSKRYLFIEKSKNWYGRKLAIALNHRYKISFGFAGLFIGVILIASATMNFVLFPESSADQFIIQVEAPVESQLVTTLEHVKRVESELLKLPSSEVEAFTTRIGMFGNAHNTSEKENFSVTYVDLTPIGNRKKTARQIVASLKKITDTFEGVKIQYNIDGGGPPVGEPITLRIVGDNDQQRNSLASEMESFLISIPGVLELERSDKLENNQISLGLNHAKMSRYGVSVSDVTETIRTAYNGSIATNVRYGDEDVGFRVEVNQSDRNSIGTLNALLIPNKAGRLVHLSDIASVQEIPGTPNFYHYNSQRSITISGDIDKSKLTVSEVVTQVKTQFDIPKNWPELSLIIGGEAKETEESVQSLMITFIAAIIGIYLLLMLLFNSMIQPFLVIAAIPFGIIGVIFAFAMHGEDLGFLAMIGTVGLSGVVVNDSLVMVNHFNTLLKKSPKQDINKIIIEGAKNRFRPIILTSLTTICGLLPLAYGIGGSDPFIVPMALALGYGLFFSTPLTLFFLPCFYGVFFDLRQNLDGKKWFKRNTKETVTN